MRALCGILLALLTVSPCSAPLGLEDGDMEQPGRKLWADYGTPVGVDKSPRTGHAGRRLERVQGPKKPRTEDRGRVFGLRPSAFGGRPSAKGWIDQGSILASGVVAAVMAGGLRSSIIFAGVVAVLPQASRLCCQNQRDTGETPVVPTHVKLR